MVPFKRAIIDLDYSDISSPPELIALLRRRQD